MNTTYPVNQQKLLSLQDAAQKLEVPVETLLMWNEYHILKPTITLTGTVGYTQEQIDQFLRIKQSFQTAPQAQQPFPAPAHKPTPPSLTTNPATPISTDQFQSEIKHPTRTNKLPAFLLPSSVIALLILAVAFATQQEHLKSLVHDYEQSYQTQSPTPSQTSNLAMNSPLIFATQGKSDGTLGKNLQTDDQSIFAKKTENASSTSKTITNTTASTQQRQSPTASVAGVMKLLQAQKAAVAHASSPDESPLGSVSTLANVATQVKSAGSGNGTFDNSGNIIGNTTKGNVLAMNLGSTDIMGDSRPYDELSTNLRNQLIFAVISGLGFVLLLLRKPRKAIATASLIQNAVASEKILEVDQKMDGTVVLTFQGKDYKISKPELDSDSDQFIARLMKLVPSGIKEVEYDSFHDEKTKLAAPLSRLVTRLGFVGVKRDLFFPRTSKNRVLFRKYVTRDDLAAMHISLEQIQNDIVLTA